MQPAYLLNYMQTYAAPLCIWLVQGLVKGRAGQMALADVLQPR